MDADNEDFAGQEVPQIVHQETEGGVVRGDRGTCGDLIGHKESDVARLSACIQRVQDDQMCGPEFLDLAREVLWCGFADKDLHRGLLDRVMPRVLQETVQFLCGQEACGVVCPQGRAYGQDCDPLGPAKVSL